MCKKRFLPVKPGQLGLRQSDALFHHTTALPEMLHELAQEFDLTRIDAVGVSQKPRPAEGSYMPCFLAGVNAATAFAAARSIPLIYTTHQQGHAAAALFAARGADLLRRKSCCFIFPVARRICCCVMRYARSPNLALARTFTPDRLWTAWASSSGLPSRRVQRCLALLQRARKRSGRNLA